MFTPFEQETPSIIKVIGVGGGGGNALNNIIEKYQQNNETSIANVEFYYLNTDAQVLKASKAANKVQIGAETTKGLGAGTDPNVGRRAAEEDRHALENILQGATIVFIATGMGGGTGTGATPIVAEIAKSLNILTVAVVTKPFSFEGNKRMNYAEEGISELSKYADSVIIIPNDRVMKLMPKNTPMKQSFSIIDDVLGNAVLGVTDLMTRPGYVNVDVADVITIMRDMGRAMMGVGIGEGENRASEAVKMAIESPLLEDVDLKGAKGILVNITADEDISMGEINDIMEQIHKLADENANIKMGTSFDQEWAGKVRITLIATGIGEPSANKSEPQQPVMQQPRHNVVNNNHLSAVQESIPDFLR